MLVGLDAHELVLSAFQRTVPTQNSIWHHLDLGRKLSALSRARRLGSFPYFFILQYALLLSRLWLLVLDLHGSGHGLWLSFSGWAFRSSL